MEKDTSKELWRIIYEKAGWIKSLSPSILNDDGRIIKKKKEIANMINSYHRDKIESLITGIPITNTNPLTWLRNRMVT